MDNLYALGLAVAGFAFLSSCGFNKLGCSNVFSATAWRKPDSVVDALQIKPGTRIADVGAGDGYFTFRLADAVGPDGHVYAVEVTDKLVAKLRAEVDSRGYRNVTVVKGDFDDPKLPDGGVDIAFFSGVFHHVEEREKYFTRLRTDLAPDGRVAIIEGAPDPLHKLFMPFHFIDAETVDREMTAAGYRRAEEFDFLPMMNFQVFEPRA